MMFSVVVLSAVLAVVGPQAALPLAVTKPVSCSVPKTCASFNNASTGSAVQATSAGGTAVSATSASGNYLTPPVDGESANASGNDAGAGFGLDFLATNNAPLYGALAFGSGDGLYGETESDGSASGYAGVFGYESGGGGSLPDLNAGVIGQSNASTGVLGIANSAPTYPGFGRLPIGVYGVSGTSGGGIGVFGESDGFGIVGYDPQLDSFTELATSEALVYAVNESNNAKFEVSNVGNVSVSGTLTTSKGTYVQRTAASGAIRRSYDEETTAPEIEDVGEAELTNGRAAVPIDPALGDTIDTREGYHVFVTPEGDCRGLYVAQKSASGFMVRELQGGRSTMTFEYRIIARPLHEDGARLAIEPALAPRHDAIFDAAAKPRHRLAPFLTPEARLKARIGTQAYAEAMLERRSRAGSK